MEHVIDFTAGVAGESWRILLDSSPYILFGFLVAALLKALIRDETVARHLGGHGPASVFKAALLGAPIPLCSCGVVPTTISLRRQGAGRGAATSFLISTPETGADSIALTYALLDPLMTLFRPLAALVTAVAAGLAENLLPEREESAAASEGAEAAAQGGCGCSSCAAEARVRPGFGKRMRGSLEYAFGDLLADVGQWLLIGIILAGLISYILPGDFFSRHFESDISQMLVMLAAGLPLYICASASTPVAAALVMKGLSPGAALVLLLAGPATNAATMTLVARFMGRRSLVVYLSVIAIFSVLLGLLLDFIYASFHMTLTPRLGAGAELFPTWFAVSASILLLLLVGRAVWKERTEGDGCDRP